MLCAGEIFHLRSRPIGPDLRHCRFRTDGWYRRRRQPDGRVRPVERGLRPEASQHYDDLEKSAHAAGQVRQDISGTQRVDGDRRAAEPVGERPAQHRARLLGRPVGADPAEPPRLVPGIGKIEAARGHRGDGDDPGVAACRPYYTVNSMEGSRHQPQIGALLRMAWESLQSEVYANLRAAGFDDLREAHRPFLRNLPIDGMRPTDLAIRLGLSKQATNDLFRDLERTGYIRLERDPSDGRSTMARRVAANWSYCC
jgi:MarR family